MDRAYNLLNELIINGQICEASQMSVLNIMDDYDKNNYQT